MLPSKPPPNMSQPTPDAAAEWPSIKQLIPSARPTALLFPGQGSQQVGMVKELASQFPVARETMEAADDVLGFDLSTLCFEGPEETLTDTINAQPAILAASIAILRVLRSQSSAVEQAEGAASGLRFVAGHSLGEYTALVAAGSLNFADGLRLVRERGRLMKEAGAARSGMMAAVLGLDEESVAAACTRAASEGTVQIANDNCPGQIVISGERAGVEAAMSLLAEAGARKVVPLNVSVASHSPLMQPATDALSHTVDGTLIEPPAVPLIANTTAQPIERPEAIRDELLAQLTGSVRWTESMQMAAQAGATHFIEIGPGSVVAGFMKRIDRKAKRLSVNDPASVEQFFTLMGS